MKKQLSVVPSEKANLTAYHLADNRNSCFYVENKKEVTNLMTSDSPTDEKKL